MAHRRSSSTLSWPIGLLGLLLALLQGCTPSEPVRIGFLGGVSGRVADLGIGGRNGASLAVELRNQAGGIGGRKIELLVQDDEQDPETAKRAVAQLIDKKVVAIVGPMTSVVAAATVPLVNSAQVLMISPTVTAKSLAGLDDYFFRVIASTTEYASKSAAFHHGQQGSRRVAVAYDVRNLAYSQSWLEDYRAGFEGAGGVIAVALPFSSSEEVRFAGLAEQLLGARPDSVLILANSVDAALLAQQVRQRDTRVRINASEWAATERLIELGGKAVEGLVFAQFLDRDSQRPDYLRFRKNFLDRFGQEPGFPGVNAFDATNVVLDALAAQAPGQTLKQAILARRNFQGVQALIHFDASGDSASQTFMTTIRNGVFERLR